MLKLKTGNAAVRATCASSCILWALIVRGGQGAGIEYLPDRLARYWRLGPLVVGGGLDLLGRIAFGRGDLESPGLALDLGHLA